MRSTLGVACVTAVVMVVAPAYIRAQGLIPQPPRDPQFRQAYRRLHFSPNGTGYAASDTALIRTNDHGASWQPLIEMSRDRGGMILDAFFLDASTFFVLRAPHQLLKTADGGDSFVSLLEAVPKETSTTAPVRPGFFFVDIHNGWALGAGEFLRTRDGGQTWGRVRMRVASPHFLWMFDLSHGIAVGGRVVSATNDGGTSWEEIPETPQLDWVRCRLDGSCTGLSASKADYGLAYQTNDRGRTWQTTTTGLVWGPDLIRDLQLNREGDAVIVGQTGRRSNEELRGYIGSGHPIPATDTSRAFMLTRDGMGWARREYAEIEDGFWTVHFASASEAWASAGENGLLRSTDGCATWTFVRDYYHHVAALTPKPTPFPFHPPAQP